MINVVTTDIESPCSFILTEQEETSLLFLANLVFVSFDQIRIIRESQTNTSPVTYLAFIDYRQTKSTELPKLLTYEKIHWAEFLFLTLPIHYYSLAKDELFQKQLHDYMRALSSIYTTTKTPLTIINTAIAFATLLNAKKTGDTV